MYVCAYIQLQWFQVANLSLLSIVVHSLSSAWKFAGGPVAVIRGQNHDSDDLLWHQVGELFAEVLFVPLARIKALRLVQPSTSHHHQSVIDSKEGRKHLVSNVPLIAYVCTRIRTHTHTHTHTRTHARIRSSWGQPEKITFLLAVVGLGLAELRSLGLAILDFCLARCRSAGSLGVLSVMSIVNGHRRQGRLASTGRA